MILGKTYIDRQTLGKDSTWGSVMNIHKKVCWLVCVKKPIDCILRNVERQTKHVYTLAHSTQDHQIKGKKQLLDLTESINFLPDKFKEYEEEK